MVDIIEPKLYEYDIIDNILYEIKTPKNILICNP